MQRIGMHVPKRKVPKQKELFFLKIYCQKAIIFLSILEKNKSFVEKKIVGSDGRKPQETLKKTRPVEVTWNKRDKMK